MDSFKDLLILHMSKEIEEAIKHMEFNNDNLCEAIDLLDIKRALELKKEEQLKNSGPDTKIPDELYPCKCFGPTQDELDEVLSLYWEKTAKNKEEKDKSSSNYPEVPIDRSFSNNSIPVMGVICKTVSDIYSSQSNSQTNQLGFNNRENSKQSPQNTSSSPEEKAFRNAFKTAKWELINNAKKNNRQIPQELLQDPATTGVKRLGMRIVGSKSKPVIKEVDDMDLEENVDDQLKGIDSKMLERLKMDVIAKPCNTSWNDIKGLEYAKETMMEAIVYPLLRPDLFSGLRRPPKGVLMFGPPGTGKTLIAKCVANNANATFFNVSASTLTSKWIGEGEMMVRTLFTYARVKQPSVVFIDEVDCLLSQRSESEHESSRRLKTEFLVFLDGCGTGESDRVLLIGATNRPQELDEAARRRFTKRLYIPLPDKEARYDMITYHLTKNQNNLTEFEIQELAETTEGYTGADIKVVAEEAGMMPFRDLLKKGGLSMIKEEDIPPMEMEHFKRALKKTRPSVSPEDLHQYIEWDKRFGSGSGD